MNAIAKSPESLPDKVPDKESGLFEKLMAFIETKLNLNKLKGEIFGESNGGIFEWFKSLFKKDSGVEAEEVSVEFKDSVVEKIKANLSAKQLNNAKIIEREFRSAGLSKNVVAAAIINAKRESGLDNNIIGDGGRSVGLFQLHERGGGIGMSVAERQDPVKNTQKIIEHVKGRSGRKLLEADKNGENITELSIIFMRDVERPANKERGAANCRRISKQLFG